MKSAIIYIAILLIPLFANSQRKKSLFHKATDRLLENKDDAALDLFKKAYKHELENRASIQWFIADIEYRKGLKPEAELKHKGLLESSNGRDHFMQYNVNHKLADIHTERSDYPGALKYLRASENHKFRFGCGTGRYDREYDLNFKYAVCFNGLNQLDSAIKRLSRFMFKESGLFTGGKENTQRSHFFYGLLARKYGECQVGEELINSMNDLHYSSRLDTSSTFGKLKMNMIECHLVFFGQVIPILNQGYSGPLNDEHPLYSKQGCMGLIRKSPLYSLIMEGLTL